MKRITLPPVCPFDSTEGEHFGFTTRDGASFRIWPLTTDHSWFLRVFIESDEYVSFLLTDRAGLVDEIAPLLPLLYGRERRKTMRLLHRWQVATMGYRMTPI